MKLNPLERIVVETIPRRFWQLQVVRWMARAAMPAPGGRLLEIGCGTGHALHWLRRAFGKQRLTAVDLDRRMLAAAAERLREAPRIRASLACTDASHLPFASGAFDAVVGFGFLHHVPQWQLALAEVARVLRPGGYYFLEEFYPALYQNMLTRHLLVHPEENRFVSRDLHAEWTAVGFETLARFELRPYYVLAVGRLAPGGQG